MNDKDRQEDVNRKIHELMGRGCWHEVEEQACGLWQCVKCNFVPAWPGPYENRRYSTDISASMEAVEWMRKERYADIRITTHPENMWFVEVESFEDGASTVIGASLPAAICAAILKATETT